VKTGAFRIGRRPKRNLLAALGEYTPAAINRVSAEVTLRGWLRRGWWQLPGTHIHPLTRERRDYCLVQATRSNLAAEVAAPSEMI
jgi:hypothetical protein